MGIVRRQSIWLTLVQYIGLIIGYVNTILLFPNFLTSDEFGLTRLLMSVTIVISQFAQIGSPAMIIRFYPYLKEKILYIGFLICGVGLTLTLGFIEVFKDWIISFYEKDSALFVDYFYLLIPLSIAMVYYNLFDAYLKAIYKTVLSATLPFVLLRIIWLILILIYARGEMSFETFIIYFAMAYTVIALIALIYIGILKAFPKNLTLDTEDRKSLKKILKFNSFNILSGLSSFMINRVDVIMLSALEGLTATGIYAIAFAMASVIRIPASAIARIAPSLIAQAFKTNDMEQIRLLYEKSSINQLILSLGSYVLIALNIPLLFLFLDDTYHEAFYVFLILGLSTVIDTGVGVNVYIMVNSRYYRTDAFLSVVLFVITLITNAIFIPLFGMYGAAGATLLSILIYNIARWAFLKQKMNLSPFTSKTIEVILIYGVAGAIAFFMPAPENIWFACIVQTIVFLGIAGPLTLYRNLSPDLTELVQMGLDRIRK